MANEITEKLNPVEFLSDVIIDENLTVNKDLVVQGNITALGKSTVEEVDHVLTKGALTVINSENNELKSTLMGTVIRTGGGTPGSDYAIVYDPANEAIRLGVGTYDDKENQFEFAENEGYPIAVRDLTNDDNDYLVRWDAATCSLKRSALQIKEGKLYLNGSLFDITDENVILKSDLKTYYNVGKITNASGTNPVEIGKEGDSLRTVFNNLFNMDEVQPTKTNPSIRALSLSSDASDERGTEIKAVSYSITFEDGSYTNSSTTGSKMTSYSFSKGTFSSSSPESSSGTLSLPSTYTVGKTASFSTKLTANYSEGDVAKTNLGNPSDPEVYIEAGQCTKDATFSKTAVDYPYYISDSAGTVAELAEKKFAKKTTSLTSDAGETCDYITDGYVWIFVRKEDDESYQPDKTIQAYSDIAKDWGPFLGGTERMSTISFNKANGVSDVFFAYRTKTTAGSGDSALFRLI